LEVLLLKRTEEARFMPGVWVFPGGAVDPEDGEGEAGYRACAIRELEEEAGIVLPAEEELVLFSRWITPEVISRRFDAWFFLALAPAHTPPEPDGVETTEARWFEPAAALKAQEAGELALAFPTISQLQSLVPYRTSTEALEARRGREVEPILPKVIGTQESHRVVLPGDPDYPA
jgi:8-oxo-dGTP pyrophosphatase MutT (NUDIX family)